MNIEASLIPIVGFIGTTELILIFAVLLLLFGARKLPDLARGLGQSLKEFKKASKELEDNDDTQEVEAPKKIDQKKSSDNSRN